MTGHCAVLTFKKAVAGNTTTAMVTVTLADADLVGSAWETAVIVTLAGVGGTEGAVYSPVASIMPKVAFPPGTLFTSQLTVVFALP